MCCDASLFAWVPLPLVQWFRKSKRDLPFRNDPTPYHIWLSEIMLQQTRMEAVTPYYKRFLNAFPTIPALAGASEEALLKCWEGLGYYSRARNLKKAAQIVTNDWGGWLPRTAEEWKSLPGIGEYTAGAILSIAFGEAVPAVDGNVLRVVSRFLDKDWDITQPSVRKAVGEIVEQNIPHTCPGDFNQALMELGALICLPNGAPVCAQCPLRAHCLGLQNGTAATLPRKPQKKPRRIEERTVFLLFYHNTVAIQKRPEKGLLAGLWELPASDGALAPDEAQDFLAVHYGIRVQTLSAEPAASHTFSHLEWHMRAYSAQTEPSSRDSALRWVTMEELLHSFALPSAFRAYRPCIAAGLAQADPPLPARAELVEK